MSDERRRYTIRLLPDRELPEDLAAYVAREQAYWAEKLRVKPRRDEPEETED